MLQPALTNDTHVEIVLHELCDAVLTYRLLADSTYVLGQPILLGFNLENTSGSTTWVLKWQTPLEDFKGSFLTVVCDGVEIPYRGRMVKRGQPWREDYVEIRSGTSVKGHIDLAQAYRLVPCSECRLTFCGRIQDVATDGHAIPRATDKHQATNISGHDAVFGILRTPRTRL